MGVERSRKFLGLTADERRALRRERLIEAALDEFGRHGFHAVGVREICGAAELTERYFYESFPNREALFLAVYQRAVASIRVATRAAIEASSPDVFDMAPRALRAFFETLREEPRLARILLIDVLTINPDVAHQSRVAMQSFADMVGDLAFALHPGLVKRELDPKLIGNGLIGSTVFIAMQWAFGGFEESVETVVRHAASFYGAIVNATDGPESI